MRPDVLHLGLFTLSVRPKQSYRERSECLQVTVVTEAGKVLKVRHTIGLYLHFFLQLVSVMVDSQQT